MPRLGRKRVTMEKEQIIADTTKMECDEIISELKEKGITI